MLFHFLKIIRAYVSIEYSLPIPIIETYTVNSFCNHLLIVCTEQLYVVCN